MISLKLGLKTLVMVIVTAGFLEAAPLQDANKVSDDSTKKITALFKAHCNRCHGEKKPGGMVRLDNLPFDLTSHSDIWFSVREQIDQELMPPDNGKSSPRKMPKSSSIGSISSLKPLPQGYLIKAISFRMNYCLRKSYP